MLTSFPYTMLKLSKTTYPQKPFANDCVTLHTYFFFHKIYICANGRACLWLGPLALTWTWRDSSTVGGDTVTCDQQLGRHGRGIVFPQGMRTPGRRVGATRRRDAQQTGSVPVHATAREAGLHCFLSALCSGCTEELSRQSSFGHVDVLGGFAKRNQQRIEDTHMLNAETAAK